MARIDWHRFVNNIKPLIKGKKILAIGCSDGGNDLAFGNKESLGVDCDKQELKRARDKGLRVRYGFAGKTDLHGEKFEVVTIIHLLEHLETRKEVCDTLKSAYDVLENGGTLIVATPYAYDSSAWTNWEHVRCFTMNSLSVLIENAGFRILDSYSYWHIPFEPYLLNHGIGNFRFPFKRDYILKLFANFNLVRDLWIIARKEK